ncbi:penicillin-binding protein 2 [Actinophytocola sp.]|uniref:peptidoglycan D,D-transpeptidase FtsI family protein n=1 Tax=Actinophytocola sp. TaxID=1872138 RepID=UPI002D802745|nr:penicillin-binding protein 2 [Actinophytocola sp.]HET9142885.1 penicillin-binding protein 2 [Actinophytocola sp.]
MRRVRGGRPVRRPTARRAPPPPVRRKRRLRPRVRLRPRPGPVRPPKRRRPGDSRRRLIIVRLLLVTSLVAAGLRLVQVQGFEAAALAARAESQRATEIDIPATRGAITDRNGMKLAFSVESRVLAYRPNPQRREIEAFNRKNRTSVSYDERAAYVGRVLRETLGTQVNEQEVVDKLRRDTSFVYLVDNVEPAKAREIQKKIPEINVEYRAERQYPGHTLASNIVGVANWRMDDPDPEKHNLHGLAGLELLRDNDLAGKPGRMIVDTENSSGVIIPGTERELEAATDGTDLQLTIDADLQYFLQQRVADYAARSGAKNASAVIMDAHTGEVYALANDKTFDPTAKSFDLNAMNDLAVTTPYEPGSVNKVVTALSAIEYGTTNPERVLQVPDQIQFADRRIHDAWDHGLVNLTTTGIFAKSSNVGTLMLAKEVGPDRYADMLNRLGLGKRTGVGLPGESAGRVPPRGQWSGSTFGNLPIGQGLSMTVLQMAGMYQTVANGGVRVPPRIIQAKINPDGTRVPEPRPEGVRVVSEQTAETVRNMLRAVTQKAPNGNSGTAPNAALVGYQISGKTGTAQQVDRTGHYSDSQYWITFAGILPADNPRFVVGIMLDGPHGSVEARSAAPLFHDIASFLAQTYSIPMSKEQSPVVPLQLP